MDEKKFEAGGQAPQENQNTQENINNQSGAAQQNAQQNAGSSESGSSSSFLRVKPIPIPVMKRSPWACPG